MQQPFTQPETCQTGQAYFLKIERNGSGPIYQPVSFLAYRPCPGEVLVHDGLKPRVVHRTYLYQKGVGNGRGFLGQSAGDQP